MGGSTDEKFHLDYNGFKPANISAKEIVSHLSYAEENRAFTGIKVIDDVFGGILPTDLVLLGAKTGVGKTAIASQIAINNSSKQRDVFMFALEAEKDEIQMRIVYELVVKKARAFGSRKSYNYKHWRLGKYTNLDGYYDDCLKEVNNFKNFHIFYRNSKFTAFDFVKEVMAIKEKAKLVILDHIHYLDLEGDNENKAMSEAIRDIREVNLLAKCPMIVIAHLRKGISSKVKLIPDLDDFMGSSDLSKVCTKAVIMAKAAFKDGISETYFHFPKFRGYSTPSNYLFKANYNLATNAYLNEYAVARFMENSPSFNFMENIVDHKERLSWLG